SCGAPHLIFTEPPGCLLGEARVASGHAERGRDEILHHAGGPELLRLEPGVRPRWYEVLVDAELALGRFDDALAWVERAERLVEPGVTPIRQATARRAYAAVLLAQGQPDEAAALADEAAELFAAGR